jgi:hypothetical protein
MPNGLPNTLVNRTAFVQAAAIQYGVLLGYILGGIAALIFLFVKNSRLRRRLADEPYLAENAPIEEDPSISDEPPADEV